MELRRALDFVFFSSVLLINCQLDFISSSPSPSAAAASSALFPNPFASSYSICDSGDIQFELYSGYLADIKPFKVIFDLQPRKCLKLCSESAGCKSINIDYKKGSCELLAENTKTSGRERSLRENSSNNYYEKFCLPGAKHSCSKKDWAFERIRGHELVGNRIDFKQVSSEATTREQCEAACLNHTAFLCRSAEFDHQLKECRLNPYSRFNINDKKVYLHSSRSTIDYLENNCFDEAKGFCSWKSVKNHRLISADYILMTKSAQECERECLTIKNFICRSYSFDISSKTCALSHHARQSVPKQSYVSHPSTEYHEITSCFDVSVNCEHNMMRANVKTNKIFDGKIYTQEKAQSCFLDVGNSLDFSLPIFINGDDCGTKTENEGQFANVLVIQNNDQVMTSHDKAIGVRCSYDVGNQTMETSIAVQDINLTDRSRGTAKLPNLSLHIMGTDGRETDVVNLGELLKIQVRMSDEDTYGIFVRNLVAKDGTGFNNLTLIDNSGCPVEAKMMREVRTIDKQSKSLESYLEAFSFTGSSTLELEAEVETCLDRCRPVQCQIVTGRSDDNYETVASYGRRKRSAITDPDAAVKGDILSSTTLSKRLKIEAAQFGIGKKSASQMNRGQPVTAPPKHNKNSQRDHLSSFKILVDEFGFYCFEPTTLATLSGVTLFIQGFMFTTAIIMASKINSPEKFVAKNNIY